MPPAKAASRRSTRRNVSTQGTQALEDTSTALVEPQSVSHEKSVSSQDAPEPVEMPPPDTIPASATPPRPPVQRLDSLNRPSSSTPTTSTIKPALKYKPKNIRRSKEEREAAELAEAERTRQRLAAAGNATTVSSRGNWPGRGGSRGRGYSGRGVRGGREFVSTASGPFGSGSVPTFEKKRLTIPGLGRSTLSSTAPSSTVKTTPRIKKEPRIRADKDGDVNMDEKKPRVKAEIDETVYISSDDEEEEKKEGPRMDIEQINLVSDDDGEEDRDTSKGKGRAKSIGTSTGGLKPIRIERRPHAERSVAVNTEASSAVSAQLRQQGTGDVEEGDLSLPAGLRPASVKRKGKARSKDIEFIKDERRWRGVWQTNDEGEEVIVKEEPEEAEDVTIMEVEPAALETPMDSSAENAKPLKHMAGDLDVDEKGAHKPKTRRRKKAGLRDEKPILQTEEDRQEWARHQQDIHLLVDELGLMPTAASIASVTTNLDPQGDTTINNTTAPTQEVKDDRLFLFQFPPIIPGLVDMMLKEEPSETNYQSAKAESASAAASSHEAGAGTLAKGSKSASNLKADQKSNLKPVALTADMSYVPKGLAGKLTVHESGRTIISWGGSSLELGRAADSEFLQDVVLVDVTHNGQSQISSGGGLGGDEGAEVQRRNGLGLGSVMGKYVVTPDWMGLV
ncbi:MAG: hypothetical protein M1835_005932 [Candelina submexicana]|nr:MAG: hypothetical protein M1835_005932 [Candelina submexicana]